MLLYNQISLNMIVLIFSRESSDTDRSFDSIILSFENLKLGNTQSRKDHIRWFYIKSLAETPPLFLSSKLAPCLTNNLEIAVSPL